MDNFIIAINILVFWNVLDLNYPCFYRYLLILNTRDWKLITCHASHTQQSHINRLIVCSNKYIPAPKADSLQFILRSFAEGSSMEGRRWSFRAPIWCSFLHASKHTSCFDIWELLLKGPTIVWKAALGGKVNLHS